MDNAVAQVYRAAAVRWAPLVGQGVSIAITGYPTGTSSTVLTSRFAVGASIGTASVRAMRSYPQRSVRSSEFKFLCLACAG